MNIPPGTPMPPPPHLPAAVLLCGVLFLTACVSTRYKQAKADTPPPQMLNVAFAPARLEATLNTVITYNGPGSWKRDAFWDEYVVTLHNSGTQPLTVNTVSLVDFAGAPRAAGSEPWSLEKESKTLEQRYKDAGVAFARYTVPGVLIVGAGAAAFASAGGFYVAAGTAAVATVVVLPVYYIGVLSINHHNKVAMEKEFARRRLVLPLALLPGETRTGSFFFPMVPSPRSLRVAWAAKQDEGEAVLALEFLAGLHIKAPRAPQAAH